MPKLTAAATAPQLRIGCNITVTGSKSLTMEEKEALSIPAAVRILVVDAEDPTNVLADEKAAFCEFTSGNVGYKLHQGCEFKTESA